jgi:hypothetical protein
MAAASPRENIDAMSDDRTANSRASVLRPLAGFGIRAAANTLRPFAGVMEAAAEAGLSLERRAVDRLLDSDEVERVVIVAINSTHLQEAMQKALASDGAAQLIDGLFDSGLLDRFFVRLFDSGLLDRFLDRLLASEALWHMIDEIAASPAVTAAISQQGLGFADQVGDEVRTRSRNADDWMERAARRLIHRQPRVRPPQPDAST